MAYKLKALLVLVEDPGTLILIPASTRLLTATLVLGDQTSSTDLCGQGTHMMPIKTCRQNIHIKMNVKNKNNLS